LATSGLTVKSPEDIFGAGMDIATKSTWRRKMKLGDLNAGTVKCSPQQL
jgi:hypothetical protein